MSREIYTPSKRRGTYKNVNTSIGEKFFDDITVVLRKSRMMKTDTKVKRMPQVAIYDASRNCRHFLRGDLQETMGVDWLGSAVCDQVKGSETSLSSWANEDKCWLVRGICAYSIVAGLVHAGHSRTVRLFRETIDMNLKRHRPNTRPEVKEALNAYAEPVS